MDWRRAAAGLGEPSDPLHAPSPALDTANIGAAESAPVLDAVSAAKIKLVLLELSQEPVMPRFLA
jgi:hypothetical protein